MELTDYRWTVAASLPARLRINSGLLAGLLLGVVVCSGTAWGKPIVIGHRGAPGHLPEHTLEGYALAIDQGADFIEPDLVISKDGVLFARHENEISATTDVAEKFPGRSTEKTIDGRVISGWFLEDFTSTEVKTLRARERLPFRDQTHNGRYAIPTLKEIVVLAKRQGRKLGRTIGIYPETKHSTYFRKIGLPLEEPLVKILQEAGYDDPRAPVFIQSFEVTNLQKLKSMILTPLVQLIGRPDRGPFDLADSGDERTYSDLISADGLREVSQYARGIGPHKKLLLRGVSAKERGAVSPLVKRAHQAGLLVHAYTFRNEPRYVAKKFGSGPTAELLGFFRLGVDGVFSDFPATAVAARATYLSSKQR